jgi:hypothetical protein
MQTQDPNDARRSRPPVPETVGATDASFELGTTPTTISFALHAPVDPARLSGERPGRRVLLRVESLKSNMPAPPFDVYMNLRPGDDPERRPELRAFTMSTFGLVESSRTREQHPGNGLNFLEDVTELVTRLAAAREWDGKTVRVTFVPGPWGNYPIRVEVGRVSLVLE